MIPVTKPFLPPKEDVYNFLDGVWQRQWLTNNGPLVNELEEKLKEYLDVPNMLYLNNGTIALQIAIKALELKGEIITTPFSYVATTSSIVWEGCKPIFVDIDPNTFNIDPTKIEASITEKTSAILATHVFGNPCDIDAIDVIAKRHNLKVIYDAAHCFGSKYKGRSVFAYGDISTTSFHATKLFHTVEGGAVFCGSKELLEKMAFLRNFGHNGPEDFAMLGINGKNSELHAAVGLANFPFIDRILKSRKRQSLLYDNHLKTIGFNGVKVNNQCDFNFSYYPILFNSEAELIEIIRTLSSNGISPRRYFFPSLNKLNYVGVQKTPVSENVSQRILCLPLYYDLKDSDIDFICSILLKFKKDLF